MPHPAQADPAPAEGDDVRVVSVFTALWVIGLVALIPFGPGRALWTCVAGVALGLVGIRHTRRRRDRR